MLPADPEAELSGLIAEIYDAALDPLLWPSALPKATRFVGGQAAALLSKSTGSSAATSFYYHGVTPHYMQAYVEQYWRYDSFGIVEALGFPVCEPITTVDLVPYEEFTQGRFFREWAAPQGWVDSAWTLLDRSAAAIAFFSILRNAETGMVDDATKRRMALISPHLRRSVLIGNIVDLARTEAANFAEALEQLRAGVFFASLDGRIGHANAAGREMLAGGQPLRSVGGRLVAADERANIALQQAFAGAALGDEGLGSNAVAIPLEGAERHVAHVLPLTSGVRRTSGFDRPAVAAVFVQRQELPPVGAPELIANAYRLTPTELRVLLAVVEVGGVPEVAESLGIAETTVRTHLGRIYEKTELNRQADLLKLIAGFSSPLKH